MKGFNHLTLRISDLQRSLTFYCDILGMTLVHLARTDAYLEWGTAWICLLEKRDQKFPNEGLGMDHVAFTVEESDFHRLVNRMKKQGIPIVREPIKRGGGLSFQFQDPDGIVLEIFTGSLKERMKNWQ
ncbi:VOC family protein [Shimazuella sp. AN120528]|uniref:VOC family protein n=1 Tax=Shimazuella soli TaxID=1892854 RepID=UPI001F0DD2C5|nr:VOC family protein [Shimazuella soli]MCH5585441.1 VOC family protein [Shimazuella soli]